MPERQTPITVAALRAELMLYADDTPVVVTVPDRAQPSIDAVHPVISAGVGQGLMPDEVLASTFSLRAGVYPGRVS